MREPSSATIEHLSKRYLNTCSLNQGSVIAMCGAGRLYDIGRHHYRTRFMILFQDLHATVINAATGEVLRDFILVQRPPKTTRSPQPPKLRVLRRPRETAT